MGTEPLERKLAAILYADVAGYSRLTGEDEEGTHRALSTYLDNITASIERHNGKVLHYAGDAVLAEFASVVNALSCAVVIQRDLQARNEHIPEQRRVQFRIGINLGDVIADRDEIYGDGVLVHLTNLANRIPGTYYFDDLNGEFNEVRLSKIVDKTREVVIYRAAGGDLVEGKGAANACARAVTWGFKKAYYLTAGLRGWQRAGYPVEKDN